MWCHLSTGIGLLRSLRFVALGLLFVALSTTLLLASTSHAAQNTTKTISFQGRLQTSAGAVVADGHYNIQFKIYQGGAGTAAGNPGGSLKWTETYINNGGDSGVEVKNGFFSVNLGSVNQFGTSVDWDQDTLFLSMNVAGSATACTAFDTAPCAADDEMLPMKRVTATPYAINAGAVGGKTVDQLIQNTATLQSNTNIALQSAGDADITAYIQGRTNQTATNFLVKQGSAQTGKALDIQGSSGTSLFNIGANGSLNQAGAAHFASPLDVTVSNSSVNSLPVRIAQQGTGDVGIELAATGSSKYSLGIDATDGSFKIASSVAAGATSKLGTNSIGSSNSGGNYRHVQANKYTATQTGPVMNMSVYVNDFDSFCPNIQLGIYADNGSGTAPGALLGSSAATAATTGWNTLQLTSSASVASGTTYWLGVFTACDDTLKYTPSTGTRAHMDDASSLPSTFSASATGSGLVSLYATIDTSSGVVDSFGGDAAVFDLGPTGDATFKTSTNSNTAFQVQNSAGNDLLSVNSDDANGAPNVQIGSGSGDGTPTLLTLDQAGSAPTIVNEEAMLGSMYYDTTLGKVQCYEASGWGSCGSSPDTFVTLTPEYSNTVTNGSGLGTMTTDLCSDTLNINDGSSAQPTICGTNETYNFYNWMSSQGSAQTKSIYVTYKLPSNFKNFTAGSTSLMGRTDSANSTVTYQTYRNRSTGLTACGSAVSVSTGSQSTWQTATSGGSADPSACSFAAGDSIVFKINLTASNNANAYIANLGFTFSNN